VESQESDKMYPDGTRMIHIEFDLTSLYNLSERDSQILFTSIYNGILQKP